MSPPSTSGAAWIYHRTPHGETILREGFRDTPANYGLGWTTGCWVTDQPLGIMEGANGDDLLRARVMLAEIDRYEVVEGGKGYREWLVPAALLNALTWDWCDEDEESLADASPRCPNCFGARATPDVFGDYVACSTCVIDGGQTFVVYGEAQ